MPKSRSSKDALSTQAPDILVESAESNPAAFKHSLGKALINRLARVLSQAYPEFNSARFRKLIPLLESLEMKDRVRLIRDGLHAELPSDFPSALSIILVTAHSGVLSGFDLWPYTEFIQLYGLQDPKIALDGLRELTRLFTSEWAVRPFLKAHPELTLAYMRKCARDPNVHVRRWASEGSRPRLPWGERLTEFVKDPTPTFEILEILKCDPEMYVRKSVANHLNDITKDHPEKVIQILTRWNREVTAKDLPKLTWITKHALRTLIKQGHLPALKLIGVTPNAKIAVLDFKIHQDKIRRGEKISFEFKIRSEGTTVQKIVVDYLIHFVKANGKTAAKVFKLKTLLLEPKESFHIVKNHSFKKITTREYYSGKHRIEIQINGTIIVFSKSTEQSFKLA